MYSHEFAELLKKTATVLVKFQKIKNHTDPSMVTKKKLFIRKYKDLVGAMVGIVKEEDSYRSLNFRFENFSSENPLKLKEKNLGPVIAKIRKDLDAYFVEIPVLPELISVQKKDYKKKYLHRQFETRPSPKTPSDKIYTRDDLMDMVLATKKKRAEAKQRKKAIEDLKIYLDKIRQIDPKKIGKKISEVLKEKNLK